MKKIFSFLLIAILVLSISPLAFADEVQAFEYILPMEYSRIQQISANLFVAENEAQKASLYDISGKRLLEGYGLISERFINGVTVAEKDGMTYTINEKGEVLGSFGNRMISFGDYVLVNLSDQNNDDRPLHYYEGEFGVFDYYGNLLKTFNYDDFRTPKTWTEGIAFSGNRLIFYKNLKFGAYDEKFNVVIEPEFDGIYNFQGSCPTTRAIKDGKYGLIDKDGNTVADFIYDSIEPMYKPYAYEPFAYKVAKDEFYGVLSADDGKVIKALDEKIPWEVNEEYSLIKVSIPNSDGDGVDYGVIDFDGNIVVPIENESVFVSEGMISVKKSYDHGGYCDINGNPVTEFKYRMMSDFSEGLAFASSCIDGVWSHEVINNKGEVVFYTDNFSSGFENGMAFLGNGKFVNKSGNIIMGDECWKNVTTYDYEYTDGNVYVVYDTEANLNRRFGLVKFKESKSEPSDWAKADIEKAKELNIIDADGNYNYTVAITREEFCEIVYNYIKNALGLEDIYNAGYHIVDTNSDAVKQLVNRDIIEGKSKEQMKFDGPHGGSVDLKITFAPNDYLTREEAATILDRLLRHAGEPMTMTSNYIMFADSADISDWADSAIQVMAHFGIMNGVGDNKFAPKETYTIEQAIATVIRIYNNHSKNGAIADDKLITTTKTIHLNDGMATQIEELIIKDGCGYWIFDIKNNSDSPVKILITKDTPTGERVRDFVRAWQKENKVVTCEGTPLEDGVYYLSITTDGNNNFDGSIDITLSNKAN